MPGAAEQGRGPGTLTQWLPCLCGPFPPASPEQGNERPSVTSNKKLYSFPSVNYTTDRLTLQTSCLACFQNNYTTPSPPLPILASRAAQLRGRWASAPSTSWWTPNRSLRLARGQGRSHPVTAMGFGDRCLGDGGSLAPAISRWQGMGQLHLSSGKNDPNLLSECFGISYRGNPAGVINVKQGEETAASASAV